jgi:hypothetical protein
MASIKKQYSVTNKRDIWRLIPSESGYLVIEERDLNTKEVFFNCLKIFDGKVLFKNFQLEEKYWVGIEGIYKSTIFFHKFRKPDMPGHRGIYAFNILNKKLVWQNDDLIFSLAKDDKVFAYQTTFEGRQYYLLDSLTGEIIKGLGSEFDEINKLREESTKNDFINSFLFPKAFHQNEANSDVVEIFNKLFSDGKISGSINWLKLNDYVIFNYHEQNSNETFNNYFKVFDTVRNKIVLSETLNSKSKKMVFESYFIVGDQIFLLVEKTKLVVYRIMQ